MNTTELSLVKSENFGTVKCDFWQNKNSEYYMTREQIGTALEYSNPRISIANIHNRNADRLNKFSGVTKLITPEGGTQETTIYSSKGVYEICRFSRQPKADAFMDWVWDIIDNLRNGQLQVSNNGIALTPEIIDIKIRNMLRDELSIYKNEIKLDIDNAIRGYEQHTDKRMTEMANSFTYIKKSLENGNTNNIMSNTTAENIPDWKIETINKLKELVFSDKEKYGSVNSILRKIYLQMRNVYGIVFEQEAKEYKEKYNVLTKPSGLELVKQKEVLRNLFDCLLLNFINDNDHSVNSDIMPVITKKPEEIIRETINPLIEMCNDKTRGGNKTYRKVYERMNVGWQNRITRYVKQHGNKNRPSKFILVKTDDKLRKLFTKTVNEMIAELQAN